jgi:hypothetical protein
MIGSVAIARIQDGLGFASRHSDKILLRLKEAQRDLEKGKTLPKFLLQEAQTFTLLSGTSTVALPTGFLRMDDDNPPYFNNTGSVKPNYIRIVRSGQDAAISNWSETPATPKVAVIRKSVLDFIAPVSGDIGFTWSYYKADDLVALDEENLWLANAPEWLIGEAGLRMAMDVRDKGAVEIFTTLTAKGRAAVFAEIIASEDQGGPLVMGEEL